MDDCLKNVETKV